MKWSCLSMPSPSPLRPTPTTHHHPSPISSISSLSLLSLPCLQHTAPSQHPCTASHHSTPQSAGVVSPPGLPALARRSRPASLTEHGPRQQRHRLCLLGREDSKGVWSPLLKTQVARPPRYLLRKLRRRQPRRRLWSWLFILLQPRGAAPIRRVHLFLRAQCGQPVQQAATRARRRTRFARAAPIRLVRLWAR